MNPTRRTGTGGSTPTWSAGAWRPGPELVRSIMRELGLVPCQPRPWRFSLTEGDGQAHGHPRPGATGISPPAAPGEKMVGDITYIPTWEGWLYLATVIDCYTKEVVGWATDDNYKTPLIEKAIEMAARNHPLADGCDLPLRPRQQLHVPAVRRTLGKHNLRQSVGRTGICYDNAMAESFFAALKNERVHRTQYPTREHARAGHCEVHRILVQFEGVGTPGFSTGPRDKSAEEYLERQSAA